MRRISRTDCKDIPTFSLWWWRDTGKGGWEGIGPRNKKEWTATDFDDLETEWRKCLPAIREQVNQMFFVD
jgi:hypothetical protein